MDPRERLNDRFVARRTAEDSLQARLWTALPGIVQSFDRTKMTVSVQPSIQGSITKQDETTENVNLPILYDVPVSWQGGGGGTFVFDIKKGDECLVVFASRQIDQWWHDGGIKPTDDARMHDLSDGFAIVGVRNRTRAYSATADTLSLQADNASCYFRMNVSSGRIDILAPGGLFINGNQTNTGWIHSSGDQVAGTVSQENHVHIDPGEGNTGPPVP